MVSGPGPRQPPGRAAATPEEGYHLTEDLADQAISFIADAKQVAPDKPFYLHFCPGATHAPHHVAKEWADRYAGRFDEGWDAYRGGVRPAEATRDGAAGRGAVPHDPDVPAWESLSPDARRLAARMMEVFAGFLSHTDAQIGRLMDYLREIGELDNTLVMVVSDNGASAEGGVTGTTNEIQFFNNAPEPLEDSLARLDEIGGPNTFNHYPWGWTWAGNTPFRRWKRETYRGGVSDPFLVHWPAASRPAARSASSSRTSSTWCPPCSTCWDRTAHDHPGCHPVPAARGELRAHLRRCRGPDAPPHPVLRDVRAPGDRP